MERRRCVVAIGEDGGCGCASGGLRRCVGRMPNRHRDSWGWAGKYSRGFRHRRKRDGRQHRCHRRSLIYQKRLKDLKCYISIEQNLFHLVVNHFSGRSGQLVTSSGKQRSWGKESSSCLSSHLLFHTLATILDGVTDLFQEGYEGGNT